MDAICNPKPKRGLRQPTVLLPPTRTPPLKRPPRITLPPIAPLVTGALVFIAGVLYPHPAGPTSEWGVVALPEQDEQRWADLEAKRKKLEREGKALSPAEYEEWLALDQRKFPRNHDNSGNARPRKKDERSLEGATGLIGKDYEDFLVENLPDSSPSFKKGGREFDGAYNNGKVWFEAKSGRYWEDQVATEAGFAKFKSDMGQRQQIAKENGAEYVLFSNTPIPQKVKDYLNKKGIKYYETLN